MVKGKTSDGKIFLGLTKENIDRLKNNEPIYIKGEELSIEHDIIIGYGKNHNAIMKQFGLDKKVIVKR